MIKTIKKNSIAICYVLAFIIPVIYMLIISDALNFFPFGERCPLVADMSVQFEVYISYLKSVFFGSNDMLYTFSKTLGGDMAGFSFYYLGNPFFYLLVFLPNEWLPSGVLFIVILLIALSSLNFNIMVNNIFGFRWSSLLFSISYAFMGYFMAYYNFIIYFNNIMLLPLIILGLHEIVKKERISFRYIISLSVSIITSFYIGYMTCIFCGLFFIYLIVINNKKNIYNIKSHLIIVKEFLFDSLLSVMIASVAIFTVVFSLQNGQKINDGYGLKIARGTNFRLTDVFSGLYSISFNGNISNGHPIIFCGALGAVFAFLFFFNKEIKIKEKIASGIMILIFVMSFYIKFINRIWHGMAETVGFPYRYSFFLSFFLLFIGYKAFILMKQGTRKYHTILIFFIYIVYSLYLFIFDNQYVFLPQIILSSAFVCMILGGVYAICYKREYMYPITIGFFTIVSFDLLINGYHSINKYYEGSDPETSTVEYYDDYYNELNRLNDYVNLDNNNPSDIFRMDKLFRRHNNDAMYIGYSGLSHFSSTESSKVIDFMGDLGFCHNNMWAYYGEEGNTAFAESLLSLKYMISQYDETGKPYDLINVIDDKYVFKNPYALPIAFAAEEDIKSIEREKYNHFALQNEIAKTMTGQTYGIYRPVEVTNTTLENVEKYEKTYTRIDSEKEAYVEYELNITSPDFIYMYFNAPNNQNVKVIVDGADKGNYFTTYAWSIKCAGYFIPGTKITIRVILEQDEIEIDGYEFYYENKEELKRWYEDVNADNITVQKISSSHLVLDTETDNNRNKIVFSVPYDKGWHIYVDGSEVETSPVMDVLLSFDVSSGKHHIEMKYIPRGLIVGAIISTIGIIILLISYILERRRIKKLLRAD